MPETIIIHAIQPISGVTIFFPLSPSARVKEILRVAWKQRDRADIDVPLNIFLMAHHVILLDGDVTFNARLLIDHVRRHMIGHRLFVRVASTPGPPTAWMLMYVDVYAEPMYCHTCGRAGGFIASPNRRPLKPPYCPICFSSPRPKKRLAYVSTRCISPIGGRNSARTSDPTSPTRLIRCEVRPLKDEYCRPI